MNKNAGVRRFAWLVYVLIVFEILYMISPFAFFYYSAYGLPLDLLLRSEATSWLTLFILPHYSYSGNMLIRLHDAAGWILIVAGLTLFGIGFTQLYAAKIAGKREVTGGLYRHIRHPQYGALAILGLGTFLVWPRFLILVAFVTMLFLYYFLARAEEQECLSRFGDSYAAYRQRTGMFFPRLNRSAHAAASSGRFLPAKGIARIAAILSLYAALITVAVLGGHAVRKYALSTLASYSNDTAYVLSLVNLDRKEIRALYETVMKSEEVKARMPAGRKRLVYLLPAAWHIPELPVSFAQEHVMPETYDGNAFKALVASVTGPVAGTSGEDILGKAAGFDPHALAFINRQDHSVFNVVDPPKARWAGIAVPLF